MSFLKIDKFAQTNNTHTYTHTQNRENLTEHAFALIKLKQMNKPSKLDNLSNSRVILNLFNNLVKYVNTYFKKNLTK